MPDDKTTPADNDPQRQDELSRQRGYGEVPNKGKRLKDQTTHTAGYKRGEPDDSETDELVTSFEDERAPNVPGTVDSDKGPAPSKA